MDEKLGSLVGRSIWTHFRSTGRARKRGVSGYQFQSCYFQGSPCMGQEVSAVNGKSITYLLNETRKNIANLPHFLKVVQLCECAGKDMRKDPVVKRSLVAAYHRRCIHAKRKFSEIHMVTAVRDGTLSV